MIPVEGQKNLFRDENTGAIVNCDTVAYSQYIKMKNAKQQEKKEIDQIKQDINEIKSLLQELLNGSK
jgi:predicted transcriptional regulator